MQIKVTIEDLSQEHWEYVQRVVRTSYEFSENTVRVCATFTRGEEERHVEMPMGVMTGLMVALVSLVANKRMSAILAGLDPTDTVK